MNEHRGRMSTKIDLTLEQSQQGVSNDVLVRDFVEEHILTRNARSTKRLRELRRSSMEEIDYRCDTILDQGEPQEIEALDKPQNIKKHEINPHYCNEEKKNYWTCMNDDERINVTWEGISFKNWARVSHGKVDKMTEERI
nr:hypothetical protein [Tanacetum cinerariifolium]